jgi:hypothetical protein
MSFLNTITAVIASGAKLYKWASPTLVPVALFLGALFRPYAEQTILKGAFSEQAKLFLSFDRPAIRVGEEVGVKVWVVPNGHLPLTRGFLTITFDRQALATNELCDFGFASTDKPVAFPQSKVLQASGRSPGRFPITATLKTERATFYVTSEVLILPSSTPTGPTEQNFSGTWKLRLGDVQGTMSLVQDGTTVAGSYKLDNNVRGAFTGIRDGSSFKADFLRGSPLKKWLIDGHWKQNVGFLEIEGTAQPVFFDRQTFARDGKVTSFYAAGRAY